MFSSSEAGLSLNLNLELAILLDRLASKPQISLSCPPALGYTCMLSNSSFYVGPRAYITSSLLTDSFPSSPLFSFKDIFCFSFVYVCVYVHMSAGAYRGQKKTLDLLELYLQAFICKLHNVHGGSEFRSLDQEALNPRAIFFVVKMFLLSSMLYLK